LDAHPAALKTFAANCAMSAAERSLDALASILIPSTDLQRPGLQGYEQDVRR
jgi:hypothetical protein